MPINSASQPHVLHSLRKTILGQKTCGHWHLRIPKRRLGPVLQISGSHQLISPYAQSSHSGNSCLILKEHRTFAEIMAAPKLHFQGRKFRGKESNRGNRRKTWEKKFPVRSVERQKRIYIQETRIGCCFLQKGTMRWQEKGLKSQSNRDQMFVCFFKSMEDLWEKGHVRPRLWQRKTKQVTWKRKDK